MRSPAFVVPDALPALQAIGRIAEKANVSKTIHALVHLRASQINGCSFCVDMHSRDLKKLDEKDERIFAVAAWRESPYFTEPERAALALAEAMTRIADREDPVSDAVWNEAKRHFDEQSLASLVLSIAAINLWNRINVAVRQVAGPVPR
jgi:AhpD family alkylhydroperoxidase